MVAYMDKNIGRITDKLEQLGIGENTMILFLGDNGTEVSIRTHMGNVEIAGEKGSLTGAGTHVLMLVSWPGHTEAGMVSDIPVVPADFFATISEVAGAPPRIPTGKGELDGISFLPVLTGNPGKVREWALVEYVLEDRGNMYLGKEGRYVLNSRWKYYDSGVSCRGQAYYKAGQLFDLRNDPEEKSPVTPEYDTPESAEARRNAQAFLSGYPVPDRLRGSVPERPAVFSKPTFIK